MNSFKSERTDSSRDRIVEWGWTDWLVQSSSSSPSSPPDLSLSHILKSLCVCVCVCVTTSRKHNRKDVSRNRRDGRCWSRKRRTSRITTSFSLLCVYCAVHTQRRSLSPVNVCCMFCTLFTHTHTHTKMIKREREDGALDDCRRLRVRNEGGKSSYFLGGLASRRQRRRTRIIRLTFYICTSLSLLVELCTS